MLSNRLKIKMGIEYYTDEQGSQYRHIIGYFAY